MIIYCPTLKQDPYSLLNAASTETDTMTFAFSGAPTAVTPRDKRNNVLLAALIFFVFLALALWKISPSFVQPDSYLATPGDGHAMVGEIYDIAERFRSEGFSALFGDVSVTDRWGDPKLYGDFAVINVLWRGLFVVFSFFLEPHKVYDAIAALGFAFSGLCAYVLALRFQLKFLFAALFSLFVVSITNTAVRLEGHLMLAFLHAPMLFMAWVVDTAWEPSRKNFVFAAFGLWFSFLVNEYFGYFALWIGTALFISLRWASFRSNLKAEIRNWLPPAIVAGVVFFGLMALSHPSIVLGPILRRLGYVADLPPTRNFTAMTEFMLYGLKNPLLLFRPAVELPDSFLFNFLFRTRVTHEFTFRVGLAVPLALWLGWVWLKKNSGEVAQSLKPLLFPLGMAALFALALALHPQFRLLVWVTSVIAPMFRVSARALFFFDVALLLMFFVVAQAIVKQLAQRWAKQSLLQARLKTVAVTAAVLLLCFRDITESWSPFQRFAFHPLPAEVNFARTVRALPGGLVLELPQISRLPNGDYGALYPYKLRSAYHGMKIANFMWSEAYAETTKNFADDVNSPTASTLERLSQLGVRYLFLPASHPLTTAYRQLPLANVVLEHPQGVAVELPASAASRWSLSTFLKMYSLAQSNQNLILPVSNNETPAQEPMP